MIHTCHAPGCKQVIPPKLLSCRPHWFALPQSIRDAIWREYRSGQEVDKNPSLRYLAVQRLACSYWVFRPKSEKAAAETAKYLGEAIAFQRAAIAKGLGDPLDGLLMPKTKTARSARLKGKP